jgi:ABC-type sulfate transport system substrate-binding protein
VRKLIAVLVLAVLGLGACGGSEDRKTEAAAVSGSGGAARTTLNLVAYSTPQVVYDDLIPAFQKTAAGKGVRFRSSYGASGDQSRAVEGGLKADVVTFSTDPDLTRLVKAGLVDKNARKLISTSEVVFIVRKGNPKGIRTWDDLLKPGVQVVTPNPFTSGAAKWNLLGAYGSPSSGRGLPYVSKLIKEHVKVQPKSGREALQTFLDGQGDVLLSYAYEATTARKKGATAIDTVVPKGTIRIETVIAPAKTAGPAAQKFVDYARGAQGQRFFSAWGYGAPDATPGDFTITDLGGWSKVNDTLFDPEKGAIAKVESDNGVPTEK